MSLIRDTKKQFYDNLDPKLITDGKFLKQVKPFFSDRTPNYCNIALLEGTGIIKDNAACVGLFNNFFSDAGNGPGIDRGLAKNLVENSIEIFNSHPRILKINEMGYNSNVFSLKHVSDLNIHDVINNIDSSKAYQNDNIPPIILKENNDIFCCRYRQFSFKSEKC